MSTPGARKEGMGMVDERFHKYFGEEFVDIYGPFLECKKDSIFEAAIAGQTVLCTARVKGEAEPAQGVLRYWGPTTGLEQLTGSLTQWRRYEPGEPGSEFAGHEVPFGLITIDRNSNAAWVWWRAVERRLDTTCVGTTLGGTDSKGDVWSFDLLVFHI
jgi:hypothetical protein